MTEVPLTDAPTEDARRTDAQRVPPRYALQDKLGQGAFGRVWRAEDRLEGGEVALKVLFCGKATAEDLASEFRIAADVAHPNVVRVLDFGETTDGAAYLVMQLLRAVDFDEAAKARPLADVLRWGGQALMALDALHRRGLLHGDIKAPNVLVEPEGEGRAYLADFGLAQAADDGATGVGGTPAYLAPELLSGSTRDIRSDIYSVGVLLYEALTGSNPFVGETLRDTLRNQVQIEPPPLDEVVPAINAATSRFVARLMAKDPERRWQSPAHALAELANLSGTGSLVGSEWLLQRLQDPPLVGVDDARGCVDDLLSALAQGLGGARWVSGALGCGRSAILEKARQAALVAGIRVGRGSASLPGEWHDPLLRAVADATGADVDSLRVDASATPAVVAELIDQTVGDTPTLLLIDDLDHGTDELWTTLGLLLQALRQRPIGLGWTTAEGSAEESALDSKIALTWATAARAGHAARTHVGPLDEATGADLLTAALGGTADPASLVHPIWSAAQGCPGLMLELLRTAVEAGQVDTTPQGWTGSLDPTLLTSAEGGLANAMAALEDARIAGLDPAARGALHALVVLGQPVTLAYVADILGCDKAAARSVTEALVERGLVQANRGDAPRYHVRPALGGRIRATLDSDVAESLHRRAAQVLSQQAAPTDVATWVDVALHAAWGGSAEQALHLAEQMAVHVAAADLPRSFAQLVATLVAREADLDGAPGWPVRILRACAAGHVAAGRFAQALQAAEDARVCAWGDDSHEMLLDRLTLDVLSSLGRKDDAVSALREASKRLQRLKESGVATARDEAELAVRQAQLARLASEPEKARAAASNGLDLLGDDTGEADAGLRARLLVELATADLHQADYESCRQRGEDALLLAQATGDAVVEAQAANAVGNSLRSMGNAQDAVGYYAIARDVAARLGWIGTAGKAANNIAICHYLSGQWEEAAAEWRQAVRFAEQSGEREEKVLLLNNLGYLYFERGHADRSENAFSEGLELSVEMGSDRISMHLYGNLGELRSRQGQFPEARALYGKATELADKLDAKGERVELGRRMAELLLLQGRPADAASEAERALATAKSLGVATESARLAGILAVCAAKAGDATAAQARIGEAEALLVSSTDDSLEQTILLLHRGRVLEALGETTEALTRCNTARARFERLGALWFERECDEVIGRLRRRALVEGQTNRNGDTDDALGALWAEILSGTTSLSELAKHLLEQVIEVSGATRGTVSMQALREVEGFQVTALRQDGAQTFEGSGEAYSRTITLGVLETGQEILVENVMDDECLSSTESVRAMELHSVLCLPVQVLGATRGIVYIDSKSLIGDKLAAARPVIRALMAAFSTAVERAVYKARFETQLDLAKHVAHELRSPLGSILGYAELAESNAPYGGFSDDVRELLDVVSGEGGRMTALIGQMYDLWMADASPEVKREAHDPYDIAERVVRALRPQAKAAGIELVNEVATGLPQVLAEATGVQQVFTNLIGNALRHTPAGKRVFLRAEFVEEPENLGDRPYVILEVADEGVGLSDENKVRVFQRFDRGSNPSGDGSGLGLTICQSIVAQHGGTIWVESEWGHGARFRFSIPAFLSTNARHIDELEPDPDSGGPSLRPPIRSRRPTLAL